MSKFVDWVRDRLPYHVHAGKLAEAKLSNTHRKQIKHLGHKIANSKAVLSLRKKFDNYMRKRRSRCLYFRQVNKFDDQILRLVHSGEPLNIEEFKKLDLDDTERMASAYEKSLETIRNSLAQVRIATAIERERITNLHQMREQQYKVKVAGINHATLTHDVKFATDNPKMVHDHAMHLMLFEGVDNDKGQRCKLTDYIKKIREQHQHEVDIEYSEMSVERSKRHQQLLAEGKEADMHPDIIAFDRQLATKKVDDVTVLKQAMLAFQKDVLQYAKRHTMQIKKRRQLGNEGTQILSPKPLVNWRAAIGQDLVNMLNYYTSPKNHGQLHAFKERYEGELNLSSSRYAMLTPSPSEEVMRHIVRMEQAEKQKPTGLYEGQTQTVLRDRKVYSGTEVGEDVLLEGDIHDNFGQTEVGEEVLESETHDNSGQLNNGLFSHGPESSMEGGGYIGRRSKIRRSKFSPADTKFYSPQVPSQSTSENGTTPLNPENPESGMADTDNNNGNNGPGSWV